MNGKYKQQIELLLDVLSFSLSDERVALKGGTAINLFYRNFPRYSVDIDLCYLPIEDRNTTFENIHGILTDIKNKIEKSLGYQIQASNPLGSKKETKLFISDGKVEIKVEPNFVLRGCLFETEVKALGKEAAEELQRELSVRCLSLADTYGGKICAALDRQHPRDIFDIKLLLENEGITTDVKDSFLFYLISHNRPINELLEPRFKDFSNEYREEFVDMERVKVSLDELLDCREKLVKEIRTSLTDNDKRFLISFVSDDPDWSLFRKAEIQGYPSVRWKLMNQEKMKKVKREKYLEDVSGVPQKKRRQFRLSAL